jgi:hypothetical protein
MSTPRLSARETAVRDLLQRIADAPARTKMAVITADGKRTVPTQTRARHYRAIDRLLALGLVADEGTGAAYSLVPTADGLAELAHWEVQS